MGSGHSKTANGNSNRHNSADSTAPLTQHIAKLSIPRNSSIDRRGSVATNDSSLKTISTRDSDLGKHKNSFTTPKTRTTTNEKYAIQVDALGGHSDITRPPPMQAVRRLSELIDPEDLPMDCHIRSPSGHLLAVEQFLVHPDRPRSIRERQRDIREKVRAASRLGNVVNAASAVEKWERGCEKEAGRVRVSEEEEIKEKGKRGFWKACGCFGSY